MNPDSQAASPPISHCCHLCIEIADHLHRKRRLPFECSVTAGRADESRSLGQHSATRQLWIECPEIDICAELLNES
jgi:hypothetical protein